MSRKRWRSAACSRSDVVQRHRFVPECVCRKVVYLLRAETEVSNGKPELDTTCEKDYIIEKDFDLRAYGIRDDELFDLVTSVATLTIEPRRESGYRILSVIVVRAFGLVPTSKENGMAPTELTLDEFGLELRSEDQKKVSVRVDIQTPDVKEDFDSWLADMRARHPCRASFGTI